MNDNKEEVVVTPIEIIPEGYVKIGDELVPRTDVCFLLKPSKDILDTFQAIDGTIYQRQKDGSLKRLTPKKKRKH
jgi:hypothetical protein